MIWPTKKLGEVLEYEQPTQYIVGSTDYRNDYSIPVLTAGKTFILGNTNEKNSIFPKEKLPVIIFDDFTTAIKFVDFPFKVKSSAMKILHAKKSEADIKFLFYKMQTIKFAHDQHKRYWISEYSNLEIPLPPIGEQRKIVEKIQKLFTKIDEAGRLRAESSVASAALLPSALHQVFSCAEKEKWETRELIEVCEELFAGGDVPKDFSKTRNNNYRIPIFSNGIGEKSLYGFTRKARVNQECVTISARGTIGYPENREEPFYPAIRLIVAVPKPSVIGVRFLKYVLETIGVQGTGNTIPQLTVPMIKNKKIPLPSIAEQKKIVAYLDALSQKSRELQNLQSQTAANFSALRQSILHTAFHA